MKKQLSLKYKNQQQQFEIHDDEIFIKLNTARHNLAYNIPLEDIKNTWFVRKGEADKKSVWFHISLLINIFLIVFIVAKQNNAPQQAIQILAALTFLPFILLLKNGTETYEEKHIDSSKLCYFIYTKKTAAEVDAFIKTIYESQTKYFRRKYFIIDPIMPYHVQQERFMWLYTNKHITQNEYEVIKEDLDKFCNFNPTI